MEQDVLTYAGPVLFWIVDIIILIATIILALKHRSTAVLMMLIGKIISTFLGLSRAIIFAGYFMDFEIEHIVFTSSIISIFQALSYGLFSLGLLLFAFNYKKQIG